ncbi:MAG TPA: hypothetical protein IAA51_12185 [Candidatus Cottocaccamicrobium excrementipullorum]|nr:hypothetical protein [Candidatus Cottocaccamicrobium excrementipullorum]
MNQYFFFMRALLNPQGTENAEVKIEKLVKDKENNPLFTEDRPWEVRIDNGYPNVIYDEKQKVYRCYYTLIIEDKDCFGVSREERVQRNYCPRDDRITGVAYAESKDGIHWEKPNLGICKWKGSTSNNLIFVYAHGTGVMLDERDSNQERRYKMVTKIDKPDGTNYMAVSFSQDGIHWINPIPWQEYNPPADSHNLPFWNEKEECYMVISRIWRDGIRVAALSRSKDFIHWEKPREVARGAGFQNQIYSMPVFYWKNIYLGLASIFHEGDRLEKNFDLVDLQLTYAVNPEKFDFAVFEENILDRGSGRYPDGEFDCGCIFAGPPIVDPDGRLWVYYMGGNGCHTNFRETSLARASWEADKFAALIPRDKEMKSVVITSRIQFTGNCLEILADSLTEAQCLYMEVEVAPSWNKQGIDKFSFHESILKPLGDGWYAIRFENGNLEELKGKRVVLKFRFREAKLWALRGDFHIAEYKFED